MSMLLDTITRTNQPNFTPHRPT